MPISKRKLAANHANAQKSTGPQSTEAKEKVSQNAIKHGLTGCFRVLATEDQQMFDEVLDQFVESEQPVGAVELQLVRKMAEHNWCAARAVRLQEGCILNTETPEQAANGLCETFVRPDLERYLRYQAAHDRAYQRASQELMQRRNERRKVQSGFVSQKRAEAQEERREKQQAQRDERHKTAVALDQKRLEVTQLRAIKAAHAVAKVFDGLSPVDAARIAA